MTFHYTDPWLQARSRSMHAELDAASPDDATQSGIVRRHVNDALADRGLAYDTATHDAMLRALYQAGGTDAQLSTARMAVCMGLVATPPAPQTEAEPHDGPVMSAERTAAMLDVLMRGPMARRDFDARAAFYSSLVNTGALMPEEVAQRVAERVQARNAKKPPEGT